jgi:spore coat protein A
MLYEAAVAGLHHRRRADAGTPRVVGGKRVVFPLVPGDPRTGNARSYNLVLAPAERADVIIDFRGTNGSNGGKSFILYNDAPGPFPGGDIRNDYFHIDQTIHNTDMTLLGGPPPTPAGHGPDSRILMRFDVESTPPSTEMSFADTVSALKTELPALFAERATGGFDPPLTIGDGVTPIIKVLAEDFDEFGRLRQVLGTANAPTGLTYLDTPTEEVRDGEVQVWDIYNTTADTHPMHFHLVNVTVKGRRPYEINPDGTPAAPLRPRAGADLVAPDPNEAGWKETVRMNPGEITTVAMRFDLPKTGTPPENSPRLKNTYGIEGAEYVWHCHILEHEEHDMMRPVVVLAAPAAPAKKAPAK